MSKKNIKIKVFVISGIIALALAYFLTWSYQGLVLSESVLSNDDRMSLDDCSSLIDSIAVKFNVPHSESYPHSKGIYCTLELSFLFNKYRELRVYGITEPERQEELLKYLNEHKGLSKPISLKIYEKEVWISKSADSAYRGSEKLISKSWIE